MWEWQGARLGACQRAERAREWDGHGSARAVGGAHCTRRPSGGGGFLRAAVLPERGQRGEGERGGTVLSNAASPRHGHLRDMARARRSVSPPTLLLVSNLPSSIS